MPRSQIASRDKVYEYTQDVYVVSLLVSSPNPRGQHARIVVEGLTSEGTLYYNESQIFPDFGEDANFEGVLTQLGLSNHQGKYIVNSTNYAEYRADKLAEYNEGSKRSWSIRRERAMNMIAQIQDEIANIIQIRQQVSQLEAQGNAAEAQQLFETLPNYQYAGERRGTFLAGNGGHNCVTWCQAKLTFAQIDTVSAPLDIFKASPKKQTHPLKSARDRTVHDLPPPGQIAILPAEEARSSYLVPATGVGFAALIIGLSIWKPESAKTIFNALVSQLSPGS